jgi:hypothetical protein
LYESDTQAFTGVIGGNGLGGDPLELARRATLIGQSNANGQVAIDELEAAISDLHARRDQLQDAESAQARALRELASRRRILDGQLGSLRLRSARAAARAELAASARSADSPTPSAAPTGPPVVELASEPAPEPTFIAPVIASISPHHNDPFLVCTRARESAGDYAVVSSAGYYGAYQFAPTTWNVTATHAGRLDLVGVSPSQASEFDQDEMAWTLYGWQGNTPWGGRC